MDGAGESKKDVEPGVDTGAATPARRVVVVPTDETMGTEARDEALKSKVAVDWEAFREQGKQMVDVIADYYKDLESRPVQASVEPGYLAKLLPTEAPEDPEAFDSILKDINSKIMPGITHWQHPMFFSYFPSNSSPPGILGDMSSAMFDCIAFSWIASPACTELETITLDWLGKLVGLPDAFQSKGDGGGVIQGSASEATLVSVIAGLSKVYQTAGLDPKHDDPERIAKLSNKIVLYTSSHAHSSVAKAALIAGVPLARMRSIKTTKENNYGLQAADLERAVLEDIKAGFTPGYVCATLGTTSSGAFDDLEGIGKVCQKYKIWLHVDAAYAGAAFVCEEFREPLKGIDLVDSYSFNPHKWLLTNFDCCAMWVQQRSHLLRALSMTPEYLRSKEYDSGLVSDYRDWQIPLGRRFRSLKLWFSLRMFGAKRYREHIRRGVAHGAHLAELVSKDSRFRLSAPQCLGLVCFHLHCDGNREESNDKSKQLLDAVNASKKTFMVNTLLEGQYVIRFAMGGALTTVKHVDEAWELICDEATKIVGPAKAE